MTKDKIEQERVRFLPWLKGRFHGIGLHTIETVRGVQFRSEIAQACFEAWLAAKRDAENQLSDKKQCQEN